MTVTLHRKWCQAGVWLWDDFFPPIFLARFSHTSVQPYGSMRHWKVDNNLCVQPEIATILLMWFNSHSVYKELSFKVKICFFLSYLGNNYMFKFYFRRMQVISNKVSNIRNANEGWQDATLCDITHMMDTTVCWTRETPLLSFSVVKGSKRFALSIKLKRNDTLKFALFLLKRIPFLATQ